VERRSPPRYNSAGLSEARPPREVVNGVLKGEIGRKMIRASILLATLLGVVLCARGSVAQSLPDYSSTLVAVISGFKSDPSALQLSGKAPRWSGNSGMYQLMGDLKRAGFTTLFFNWNGTAAGKFKETSVPAAPGIAKAIRAVCEQEVIDSVMLVGHSWGGHTMLEVAAELNAEPVRRIDLAVGVDPSSIARGQRMTRLPGNVGRLVCFQTRNAFTWREWTDEPRAECVDLGSPANGFMVNGQPNYAAKFDVAAHNAVEWDERVHVAVVKRIEQAASTTNLNGANDAGQ
jgi:pimeloyl-ACP methyl ester carboxylesterase